VSVITDFGLLAPAPGSRELELVALYEGAILEEARNAVGWPLKSAASIAAVAPPTAMELDTLRALNARTRAAHSRTVRPPVC
jgi:glutaconate CoA-transferase subunit B